MRNKASLEIIINGSACNCGQNDFVNISEIPEGDSEFLIGLDANNQLVRSNGTSSGGGSGNVDDVLVDGVSVVYDKIAEIELAPINTRIDNEISARENADNNLSNKIDAEIVRATYEEGVLSQRIDAEHDVVVAIYGATSDLLNRMTSAEGAISEETIERQDADNALSGRIETIDNEISLLDENLTEEIANRIEGDQNNSNSLHVEIDNRVAGDNQLQTALSNEVSTRLSVDEQIRADLEQEIADRQSGDSLNDGKISTVANNLAGEITRAEQAEGAIRSDVNTINGKINRNVVANVVYTASATGIERNKTYINLYTGVNSNTQEAIPIVSPDTAGIMLPEHFETIYNNTARITTLENNTPVKELTVQPTKADLDNYTLPADAKEGDIADVTADETQGGASTRYRLNSNLQWQLSIVYGAPTPQATNDSLGSVMGSNEEGKGLVETDGTISVVGWDALKSSIPTAVSQLSNDNGYITAASLPTNISQLNNDSGYITAEQVPTVTDATQTTKGIATLGASGGAARFGNKADAGLSRVDNTNDLEKPISTATQAALDLKANSGDLQAHIDNKANPHTVTKGQIGLGNVDNTSDANKPISTSTQNALNAKANDLAVVHLAGMETITGAKTFNNPVIVPTPTANTHAVTKSYADGLIAGKANDNAVVHLTGAETVAGVKTFSSIPVLPASNPTSDNQAVRKAYADSLVNGKANDNAVVHLSGAETISGVKTFNSSPVVPMPTASTQAANMGYVDNQLADKQNKLTGITDVQVVSELPSTPINTVLYLIIP